MSYNKTLSVIVLREWLNCVTSVDFNLLDTYHEDACADEIVESDHEITTSDNHMQQDQSKNVSRPETQQFPPVQLDEVLNKSQANDEDTELVLQDGVKYLGAMKDGLAEGPGELHLPESWNGQSSQGEVFVRGNFKHGKLEGKAILQDLRESTTTELIYRGGVRHGPYRKFRRDNQLLLYGFYRHDKLDGQQLRVGTGNNSYFLGKMDESEQLYGRVVFLYPSLEKAIIGQFKSGKMVSGGYADLQQAFLGNQVGFPTLVFNDDIRGDLKFDPSTFMRISRTPQLADEYESEMVYVKQSRIPYAGEGLYAARDIEEGQLVCLFNGNRIAKVNNKSCIKWGDEGWSDFRLTLDKSTDLDIPEESQTTNNYCATLGHKACHSFSDRNAMFNEFEHPRFGAIMSVIATKDIHQDDEVLVSYNYTICHAPPWYQEQWVLHLTNRGVSPQQILKAREREEFKASMKLPDHLFQNIL